MGTGKNLARVCNVPEINIRVEMVIAGGCLGCPALVSPNDLVIRGGAKSGNVDKRQGKTDNEKQDGRS